MDIYQIQVCFKILDEFFATHINETTSELRKNENCLVGNLQTIYKKLGGLF